MYAQVHGIEKQLAIFDKFGDLKTYNKFQLKVVEETADLMRKLAPRNTGALENCIRVVKVGTRKYRIVISVPYAIFTEWGTRYIDIGTIEEPKAVISMSGKQSYRPWMRVAIWRMMNQNMDAIMKAFFGT